MYLYRFEQRDYETTFTVVSSALFIYYKYVLSSKIGIIVNSSEHVGYKKTNAFPHVEILRDDDFSALMIISTFYTENQLPILMSKCGAINCCSKNRFIFQKIRVLYTNMKNNPLRNFGTLRNKGESRVRLEAFTSISEASIGHITRGTKEQSSVCYNRTLP